MTKLRQLSAGMADVAQSVRGSLVHIRNGSRGAGAGTVWHRDGLVLTNAHVVSGGPIRVELPDGRDVAARVVAFDAGLDLAALTVEANGLPAVELGDSKTLRHRCPPRRGTQHETQSGRQSSWRHRCHKKTGSPWPPPRSRHSRMRWGWRC